MDEIEYTVFENHRLNFIHKLDKTTYKKCQECYIKWACSQCYAENENIQQRDCELKIKKILIVFDYMGEKIKQGKINELIKFVNGGVTYV